MHGSNTGVLIANLPVNGGDATAVNGEGGAGPDMCMIECKR